MYLESLPFGKELKQSFIKMTLRIGEQFTNANEIYRTVVLRDFMFTFYKTLLISIDKRLKESKEIGFHDVKAAIYKTENQLELNKVLKIFNSKYQNNYFEFSENGLIENHTQSEFLKLKNFIEWKGKETELKDFKFNNVRNRLEKVDPNYKLYWEIIREQICNTLNGKNVSLTKIIEPIQKKYTVDLYKTFDKWKRENLDNGRYENLINEVISDIKENQC